MRYRREGRSGHSPLKICVPILLEGGIERVDGGFDRDRLVDHRHIAHVSLGRLDELLLEVAGRAHVDGQLLPAEGQVEHPRKAAPVLSSRPWPRAS